MYEKTLTTLSGMIDRYSGTEGSTQTAIPALKCLKLTSIGTKLPTVFTPSLCIIVQGRKQVMLEQEIYHYAPSQYLVVSVDLPVMGMALEASPEQPYLCLQIDIDTHQMSELIAHTPTPTSNTARGIFVGQLDAPLLDSALRLVQLLDTPQDIPFVAPLILREIHYRLLGSPHGAMIAQLALQGSHMHRIGQVITHLKTEFQKPMRVEEMAALAKMSPSTFHAHFKEVTAMSPLQYQKRMRLLEARKLMLADATSAAHAAYQVGYESSSQFSREYARMFGAPPATDIARLRVA